MQGWLLQPTAASAKIISKLKATFHKGFFFIVMLSILQKL